MKSDLVDLEVILHHQTPKAFLVSNDGDREKSVWVPKSLCEIEEKGKSVATITLSERVAVEKGLL